MLVDVLLDGGHAERASGLENAARVLEHVLDGGAHRVGIDNDEVIDQFARQSERLDADHLDGGAVGKEADVVELHALAGFHRPHHCVGIGGLHADHLDLRSH